MYKINKKNLLYIGDYCSYLKDNEKEKRYIIEKDGVIGVRKENGIRVYFENDNDNVIRFYENNLRFAKVNLNKMEVKNYDNKKWEVTLYDCADGTMEVKLHNKEKDSFMYWLIEKDGIDYKILYENDNEYVFENPKWQFNFKDGIYYDFEKEEHFKIEDLINKDNGKNIENVITKEYLEEIKELLFGIKGKPINNEKEYLVLKGQDKMINILLEFLEKKGRRGEK